MSLPSLPEAGYVLHNPGGRWDQGYTLTESAYTEEQMQAYGQQCRSDALEEAAMLFKEQYTLTTREVISQIRSLK